MKNDPIADLRLPAVCREPTSLHGRVHQAEADGEHQQVDAAVDQQVARLGQQAVEQQRPHQHLRSLSACPRTSAGPAGSRLTDRRRRHRRRLPRRPAGSSPAGRPRAPGAPGAARSWYRPGVGLPTATGDVRRGRRSRRQWRIQNVEKGEAKSAKWGPLLSWGPHVPNTFFSVSQ